MNARARVTAKLEALRAEVLGLSDASLEAIAGSGALDTMILAVRQVATVQAVGKATLAEACNALLRRFMR